MSNSYSEAGEVLSGWTDDGLKWLREDRTSAVSFFMSRGQRER